MHAAFSRTGASCYLAGAADRLVHAWAQSLGPAPAHTNKTKTTQPSSLSAGRALPPGPRGGPPPSLPSPLRPPSSLVPSPHCPPSHWWFLPATEIQETAPHTSSTHDFLQGLTHTQSSLVWSSLCPVPGETVTHPFISGSTGWPDKVACF